ncbi:MAG: virulence factor SrfC family protein, partial [Succinivibrio sp.]
RKVAGDLVKLGGARKAYAGIDAFINSDRGPNGEMTQKRFTVNSIETVSRLFMGAGDPIDVAVAGPDGKPKVEKIDFACLGAVTLELLFPLNEQGGAGDFDVIDFPGARERDENKYDDYVRDAASNRGDIEQGRPSSHIREHGPELLRRGKVAYIFDRYTEDRAVDLLMLCLNTAAQVEVTSLTPIVDKWISLNIGASSAERAKAAHSPFLCTLTRCDQSVDKDINRPQGTPSSSSSCISKAFEKLGQARWLTDWNGKPFSQIFMVRSPGFAKGLIAKDENGRETGFDPGSTESGQPIEKAVAEYLQGLCTDPLAGQIYGGVEHAFSCMMAPNDGGISEIKKFISQNFTDYRESRARLDQRILTKAREAGSAIGAFAGAGSGTKRDAALEKARSIAAGICQCDEIASIQGFIRSLLELDDGDLKGRYLREYIEYKNAPRFAQSCMDVFKERLAGLSSGAGFDALFSMVDSAWERGSGSLTRFEDAQSRYSFFYDKVKGRFIKSGTELRERFSKLMQDLEQALRESAFSADLQGRLEAALEEHETLGGRQDIMAAIQVRTAQQMISGFLCFLGFDLPDSPKMSVERRSEVIPGADDSRPLFSEKVELAEEPQNEGETVRTLPIVSDELMSSSGRHYLEDFLWALSSLMCGRNLQSDSPFRFPEDAQNAIDRICSGFARFLAFKAE